MHLVEAEAMALGEVRRGLDVVDPFPAIHDAEFGAFGGEDRCQWGRLDRAAGGAVFVREVETEFVLIIFDGLERGQFRIAMTGEAARVQNPCVIAGFAMDDLLRQQPTMPAAFA